MSRALVLCVALAAALTVALGAGCDDKRIDIRNVESIIADRYIVDPAVNPTLAPGATVDRVICPELVRTRKGELFECKVVLQGGEERVVTVEQLGGTHFRWYAGSGASSAR